MATATTSVKKAFDTQADLKDHREHCAPSARALASLDSGPRQQVRIHRNGEFALYTVSELLHETTDSVVRMGLGGRQRLQSEDEFEGVLDTKVVDPDLCDEDARAAGELVERLDDDGSQTHLIVIAPHGGGIEAHTDEQAERVAKRLGPRLASVWRCKGWRPDGGAFVRWHITSTDLNPVCFPLLNSVMSRQFAHAVAFHGFNDEPGVLIGGTAPTDLKERLRRAIRQVLPAGVDVRVALPDERYGGDDPNNIVNRLSPCGGIQIEQGTSPRDDHGCAIADAVADLFRPATVPRKSWAVAGSSACWRKRGRRRSHSSTECAGATDRCHVVPARSPTNRLGVSRVGDPSVVLELGEEVGAEGERGGDRRGPFDDGVEVVAGSDVPPIIGGSPSERSSAPTSWGTAIGSMSGSGSGCARCRPAWGASAVAGGAGWGVCVVVAVGSSVVLGEQLVGSQPEREAQLVGVEVGDRARPRQHELGDVALAGDDLLDAFVDGAGAHEPVRDDRAALADAPRPVAGLVLDGRVPPAVVEHDVVGRGQVEAGAAGLQRQHHRARARAASGTR